MRESVEGKIQIKAPPPSPCGFRSDKTPINGVDGVEPAVESGSPLCCGIAGDQTHGFHRLERALRENSEERLREVEPHGYI